MWLSVNFSLHINIISDYGSVRWIHRGMPFYLVLERVDTLDRKNCAYVVVDTDKNFVQPSTWPPNNGVLTHRLHLAFYLHLGDHDDYSAQCP